KLLGTAERTFAALKILISALSIACLYLLGRRVLSAWVGLIAAALFFVNPVFWYSGLTSPLRLHGALFSIVVAYCCWRSMEGEKAWFYAASVALGFAGGFRPDLLLVLLPLWGWTAWRTGSWGARLRGSALLLLMTLIWIGMVAVASGGLGRMTGAFREYAVSQTYQTSPFVGARWAPWRRMVGRAILWTGLGALPWIWTIPFGWLQREWLRNWKRHMAFLVIWAAPIFLFHSLVHIGNAGHALPTIPAVCLLGGVFTVAAERQLAALWARLCSPSWLILLVAVAGNVFLFFGRLPFPTGS